ncbi:MAG: RecX family transcriptional regulator [Ideonella sp.]|nr:RecX family transcriptional regulator [Ideonella sp.]
MKRPPPSLQARALGWLAQREQSRSELRRKLLRVAMQPAASADDGPGHECDAEDAAARVDQLLDLLQAKGLLSDERFVDSRVRVRAPGLGIRRIQLELARHGLKLPAQPAQQLRDSELQRATQLWQRKFGSVAQDARERARQMRFLAGRGFSGDVIRQVLAAAAQLQDGHPRDD